MQSHTIICYMALSFTSYVNLGKLFSFTKFQSPPIKSLNEVSWSTQIWGSKNVVSSLSHSTDWKANLYPSSAPLLKTIFYFEECREICCCCFFFFKIFVLKCTLSCVYIWCPHLLLPSCCFSSLSLFINYWLSMNSVLGTEGIPWWLRQEISPVQSSAMRTKGSRKRYIKTCLGTQSSHQICLIKRHSIWDLKDK